MKTISLVLVCLCSILLGCGVQGLEEYNKGVEYQTAGKIDLAEREYKSALKKNPNLAEAHTNLAFIYLERGWLDGAESSAKRAIEIFESTKKTWFKGASWQQSLSIAYTNLGVVEMRRAIEADFKMDKVAARNHWEKGIRSFQKAVKLDGSNSQAQANLARFRNAYKE